VSHRFPTSPSVRVPRARPQTYHFFGDSRRGNILALALYPRSLLPSLRPFASPSEIDDSELPLSNSLPVPSFLFNSSSFETFDFNRSLLPLSRAPFLFHLFILRSCLPGFAKIESNRGATVSTSRHSERRLAIVPAPGRASSINRFNVSHRSLR